MFYIYTLYLQKNIILNLFKIDALKEACIHIFVLPPKISFNVCLMKILKSTATKKKVIACFYNLGVEIFKSISFCNISNFHNGFV